MLLKIGLALVCVFIGYVVGGFLMLKDIKDIHPRIKYLDVILGRRGR